MSRKLITEFVYPSVVTTSVKDGNLFIEGIFASVEAKNKNGRIYKKETLDREMKKFSESISKRCLWGELNHPTTPDVNLERAAIINCGVKTDFISFRFWRLLRFSTCNSTDEIGRAHV